MTAARLLQITAQITVKMLLVMIPGVLAAGVCALVGEPLLIMAGQ